MPLRRNHLSDNTLTDSPPHVKKRCCKCIPIRAGVLFLLATHALLQIIALVLSVRGVPTYNSRTGRTNRTMYPIAIILYAISVAFYLIGLISAVKRIVPLYNVWSTVNFGWVVAVAIANIVIYVRWRMFDWLALAVLIYMVYIAYVCWTYRKTMKAEREHLNKNNPV